MHSYVNRLHIKLLQADRQYNNSNKNPRETRVNNSKKYKRTIITFSRVFFFLFLSFSLLEFLCIRKPKYTQHISSSNCRAAIMRSSHELFSRRKSQRVTAFQKSPELLWIKSSELLMRSPCRPFCCHNFAKLFDETDVTPVALCW